jgi:hypothetical protein
VPHTAAGRAAVVLAGTLAVATLTQALFWRTGLGLNFFLWTLLSVGACLGSIRPTRLTAIGSFAIASAALLGFSVVRFAGAWAVAIAVPSVLVVLAVLPLALRDQVDLTDAARLPLDTARTLVGTRRAAREAWRIPGAALGGRHGMLAGALKGLFVGLPVTGVFVLLLRSDADFASALARIADRIGEVAAFTGWTLVTAAAGLFTHMLYAAPPGDCGRPPHFAYRCEPAPESTPAIPTSRLVVPQVLPSTWVMVIGQVALVFALFVAVNVRSLFGGDALVRAHGSLTYAKYLHAGFGQLLFAAVLSICLVALGHRLLRPRADPGAIVPGGRLLVGAEGALLALTAVTVASCAQRLAIYEDAYGASRLRLGVAFVLLTVLGALALTAAKVVTRAFRAYSGSLAVLLVGIAVLASSINADAYVARTNLDRAARGRPLDVTYLASLSADAKDVLAHSVVRASPALEARLTAAYCPDRSHQDWRSLRGLGRCDR